MKHNTLRLQVSKKRHTFVQKSNNKVMEKQRRIEKVREALANGRVSSVEFYKDGSGACFNYLDPTGDHGCPCTMASSFPIEDAIKIIAGFRFKQHELKSCF